MFSKCFSWTQHREAVVTAPLLQVLLEEVCGYADVPRIEQRTVAADSTPALCAPIPSRLPAARRPSPSMTTDPNPKLSPSTATSPLACTAPLLRATDSSSPDVPFCPSPTQNRTVLLLSVFCFTLFVPCSVEIKYNLHCIAISYKLFTLPESKTVQRP